MSGTVGIPAVHGGEDVNNATSFYATTDPRGRPPGVLVSRNEMAFTRLYNDKAYDQYG